MMHRRTTCVWTLAASLALAVVLSLVCHPALPPANGAGMSAPVAPRASLESGPAARLVPSHFHFAGELPRSSGLLAALFAFSAAECLPPAAAVATHAYPPLYRRPPPSFS